MQIWPLVHSRAASDVCSLTSSVLHRWFNLQGWAASDHNAQRKLAASTLQRPALPLDFACSVEKEKEGKDKKNTPAKPCVWASHNSKTASSAQKMKLRVCVCLCASACVCMCVF